MRDTPGVTGQAAVVTVAVVVSGRCCLLTGAVDSLCCGRLVKSRSHQGTAGRSDDTKHVGRK